MSGAPAKRQAVRELIAAGLSQTKACTALATSRSSLALRAAGTRRRGPGGRHQGDPQAQAALGLQARARAAAPGRPPEPRHRVPAARRPARSATWQGRCRPWSVRAPRRSAHAPPAAWPVRRSFSPQHFADGVDLQVALRQQALEARVLGLKLSQAADLGDLHAAVALAPAIEGVLRDAMGVADGGDGRFGRLRLAQDGDDLRLGKPRRLHSRSPLFEETLTTQAVLTAGSRPEACELVESLSASPW